ncbi:MAG: hypothetical protein RIR11_4728 [Bacteroidota bacterium]|jgi:hypothetical protein
MANSCLKNLKKLKVYIQKLKGNQNLISQAIQLKNRAKVRIFLSN